MFLEKNSVFFRRRMEAAREGDLEKLKKELQEVAYAYMHACMRDTRCARSSPPLSHAAQSVNSSQLKLHACVGRRTAAGEQKRRGRPDCAALGYEFVCELTVCVCTLARASCVRAQRVR